MTRLKLRTMTVVLMLFVSMSQGFGAKNPSAKEQLVEALTKQAELVTTLRAEFHRLKYEDIPHAYASKLVKVEKIVGKIGTNSSFIVSEIAPKLDTVVSPSVNNTNAESTNDSSMTVEQLSKWIIAHDTRIATRVKATCEMLAFVSNLTPMTLEKLAYAVTATPHYNYNDERLEIIAAGKTLLAQRAK